MSHNKIITESSHGFVGAKLRGRFSAIENQLSFYYNQEKLSGCCGQNAQLQGSFREPLFQIQIICIKLYLSAFLKAKKLSPASTYHSLNSPRENQQSWQVKDLFTNV